MNGRAAGGHQQIASFDPERTVPVFAPQPDTTLRPFDRVDRRAFMEVHAFRSQPVEHNRRQFRILPGQGLRLVHDRHLDAQAAVSPSHFESDRPPADDDKMARQAFQTEERFIGEERRLRQPRDRGNCRR